MMGLRGDLRRRRPRRPGDERGAVLVLTAVIMVTVLIIVSFIVDLGRSRLAQRETQTVSDLAAVAAGYFLSGRGDTVNGDPRSNPRLACEAAINAAQTNLENFEVTTSDKQSACLPLPEDSFGCDTSSTTTVTLTRGNHTLTIEYPITDSQISDPRYGPSGSSVLDGSDPCDRMRVTLDVTHDTAFAGVMGVEELDSSSGAVVAGDIDRTSQKNPAFLLLEREQCNVLSNSVNGAGNLGIVVDWNNNASDPQAGVIHVDSNASGSSCSGNENADGYAIWGKELSGGGPSITARDVPVAQRDGVEDPFGLIQHTATNGRGGAVYPGGLSTQPQTGEFVFGRTRVDLRYNTAGTPDASDTAAIADLHGDAYDALADADDGVDASGSWVANANYTVVDCSGTPTFDPNLDLDSDPLTSALVYVNCASYGTASTPPVLATASSIVFGGEIRLGSGASLYPANATDIVVAGELAVPQGDFRAPVAEHVYVGDGVTVDGNGQFSVNAELTNTPDGTSDCANRETGVASDADFPDDEWTTTTSLAIFGGAPALDVAGHAALCQTAVYLAGPNDVSNDDYAIQTDVSGSGGTTPCSETSCPKTVDNTATGATFLVQGFLTWVAPNQYPDTDVPNGSPRGFEDLALWTETAGVSNVMSGGVMRTTGIYFAPNGSLEMRSPAVGEPRDAQFISRSLKLLQGTLFMRPSTVNTIPFLFEGNYLIIR